MAGALPEGSPVSSGASPRTWLTRNKPTFAALEPKSEIFWRDLCGILGVAYISPGAGRYAKEVDSPLPATSVSRSATSGRGCAVVAAGAGRLAGGGMGLAILLPMASMLPIYISPGGGEGIHHASRHPPPSGGPALTGRRDTSTRKGAHSLSNPAPALPPSPSPWSR